MQHILLGIGIFFLLNAVGVASVFFSSGKKWKIDLTQFRHYTALIFNVCGIIYALFLGFVLWDVWERFYHVKKTVQEEAQYIIDLYRDATVFAESGEEPIQKKLKDYIEFVTTHEWKQMENPKVTQQGDELVNAIWESYYAYTPITETEQLWYEDSLSKLNAFNNARMSRLFNAPSQIGALRWTLLILGGVLLVMIPCFFKVDYIIFQLILTLFLANIIAFMLFIIYSLDHPFQGYVDIDKRPFEYALKEIAPW